CLLWHDVLERWSALKSGGEAPFPALQQAVDAVFDARIGDISGRGKLAADMREVWLMQPRFERRTANAALSLAGQPRFRAGYDFLRLRADVGEVPAELADWWEDFHLGDDDEREALLQDLRAAMPPKVRRVPAAEAQAPRAPAPRAAPAATAAEDAAAPPRKRRRRRSKPAGEGGSAERGPAAGE
ncbi:MAG TPA: polynucleotide adenylyltransferase PcnB, partial [Rubrivivax sp.]|nr:polynucleotide adenylyltransferase PcnB [Rubrivivax sp.]